MKNLQVVAHLSVSAWYDCQHVTVFVVQLYKLYFVYCGSVRQRGFSNALVFC